MKIFVRSLLFVVILLIPATACYAAGPWRGKVIDAETKQPVEGAAVVAVWEKDISGPAGTLQYFLDAEETATDKNGEFKIPFKIFLSIPGIRQVKGPFFTIFKPGYGSFPEHQVSPQEIPDTYFLGKTGVVELPKLNLKTREERLKNLPMMPYGIDGHEEKIKQFKKLLDAEINSINSLDKK